MPMTPAELERKVRQVDNDVQSIYELLDQLRIGQSHIGATLARHGNRLDQIEQHLDGVDQRFDGVDQRFDGVDQRFDGVDRRLDGLDAKTDEILALLRGR